MQDEKHHLGPELGAFSENEIHKSVESLGGEPIDVAQLVSEGELIAREKKQRVIDVVRSSASELLEAWKKGPDYAKILVDGYVANVEQALENAGKPDDEEGARMLLASGLEALGVAKGEPGAEDLIKMVAGSREAVKGFIESLPGPSSELVVPLSDEEIDLALEAIVAPEKTTKANN